MDVILKKTVDNLGFKDEMVTVKMTTRRKVTIMAMTQ